MEPATIHPLSVPGLGRLNYGHMPLLDLATRIVRAGDADALRELHDHRALFRSQDGRSVRLVEYVALLRESPLARRWCGYDDIVLDHAYNLTIDKFSHLPVEAAGDQGAGGQGPDCRYYFQAFVEYATAQFQLEPPARAVDADIAAAGMLRRLVHRHFHLSCLESRRRSPKKMVRRYIWKIDGRALYLWVPMEMPGGRCRRWLEASIPDVEPGRPGEQERVQATIDRLLGRPRFVSLDQTRRTIDDVVVEADPVGAMIEEEISVRALARLLADEKAEGIQEQRPAIRQLGERLRELIHEVFEDLVRGNYQANRIASRFGLSESTVSRFAGTRWKGDGERTAHASVPDLWVNAARVLSRHPAFVAAAKAAGVWKRVTEVRNGPGPGRRENG